MNGIEAIVGNIAMRAQFTAEHTEDAQPCFITDVLLYVSLTLDPCIIHVRS
jgi:hypothetical protein